VYIYPKETGLSDVVSNMIQNIFFVSYYARKNKFEMIVFICLAIW